MTNARAWCGIHNTHPKHCWYEHNPTHPRPEGGDTTPRIDLQPKPMFLGEAIVWRSESETRPGLFHYTAKLRKGGMVCSCEGFQFQGHCKHIENAPSALILEAMKVWRQNGPSTSDAS